MKANMTLETYKRYGVMSLKQNLIRLRRIKGWSQNDLANQSGLRTASINQIENEKGDPKLSTIMKLIKALECSADALLLDQGKMNMDIKMAICLERTKDLPEEAKMNVIDMIDRYCMSYGIEKLIRESEKNPWPLNGMTRWAEGQKPLVRLDKKD